MTSMDADRLQNQSPAKIPVWFCRTNHRNLKNINILFLCFKVKISLVFAMNIFTHMWPTVLVGTGNHLNYIFFSFSEVLRTGWDTRDGQDMELT